MAPWIDLQPDHQLLQIKSKVSNTKKSPKGAEGRKPLLRDKLKLDTMKAL